MQLGFVLDQSRCIGCHACTVACKSENHVPVGDFRTWVKYTEEGEFPQVKRSFAVLRCNQCSAAPCVTICPVTALDKRPDGIVDVDPKVCIGCKGCMQACPYDALYIGEHGTAEKCHFCAHRTERGLAPACAVVCPTEAIVPGDFDDPESIVSRMRREFDLTVRKPEAGTRPNVYYREAAPAGLDPTLTQQAGTQIWADRHPGLNLEVERFLAEEFQPKARTTSSTTHPPVWGWKVSAYLFTKSLAAGLMMAGAFAGIGQHAAVPLLAMAFLVITSILLVADLKRPERFLSILLRPNKKSWLVRGSWALIAYGLVLATWAAYAFGGGSLEGARGIVLVTLTALTGGLAAGYTGWLFAQSKGRVLWLRRGLWAHFVVQALVAGSAGLLLIGPWLGLDAPTTAYLMRMLTAFLGLHAAITLAEGRLAPRGREKEYARAHALVVEGPWAARHWRVGVTLGLAVPFLLLAFPVPQSLVTLAALCVLVGLWNEEDILVRAGQAPQIS